MMTASVESVERALMVTPSREGETERSLERNASSGRAENSRGRTNAMRAAAARRQMPPSVTKVRTVTG